MQSPALLCILNGPDFVLELVNDPFQQMVGSRNLTGKSLREAIPELEGQGIFEILEKVYATGKPYTGKEKPVSINRNNRKEVVYLNFSYQVFADSGDPGPKILVYAHDVTEQVLSRNLIKESELRYRELIYGLPSALYTCDAAGYIQLYNEAALLLWGRKPEIGKDRWCGCWEISKTDGSPLPLEECPMALALREGKVSHMEIVIRRPDGSTRHVIPYPQPVYDLEGRITGAVNTLIDITEQVTAARQLEQLAETVERLYMNAPAFICTLMGPDHVFKLVNPEYQKLFGRRALVGKKVGDALPELQGQGIMETLDRVYQTGEPYVVTEKLLYLSHDTGKEPEPTYLNFSHQPIYDSEKGITGVLVFGYEVTGQVLAKKKSEENLKRILESLPQITSASAADGSDIFFNKFFFEYSGISRAEASVTGWNSILHPDEVEEVLAEWEHCRKTGADFYKVIRLKRKSDDMYRWHLAHLTALKNEREEISHWIGSATDIHEQKVNEQKKDEFISIASHEMKTPLTTAKAYLQLLELSLGGADEKAKLYTQKAIHSVERLKDLISELLDVSKVHHGKLNFNFDFFDFNEMIRDAVEATQYTSPHHTIVQTGGISIPAWGDKERLQQVILNLLSNAVKYSPGCGEIQIHSEVLETGEIMFWVRDHGIGIAKNDLERIFERYFRVEGQDIHFQGLGIGLYISMEIVRRHNGKLWAESKPGKGSIFCFTLPLENT